MTLDPSRSLTRRGFLLTGAAAALGAGAAAALPAQQEALSGQGDAGTLRDPSAVGRPRVPTTSRDNDAEIQAIELRLACSCPCTLDIFTCRTTDFTCTYSPALHREIVALHESGKTAQEIIDVFVAEYGEEALMAPKAEGFNLAGYLVPGAAIATGGALLAWVIGRRRSVAAAEGGEPSPDGEPATGGVDGASGVNATPEELDRLRRALAEVED